MAYLADKYNVPDAWHPSSSSSSSSGGGQVATQQQLQRRAVYESAVHWQHLTMRAGCMRLVFHTVIGENICRLTQSLRYFCVSAAMRCTFKYVQLHCASICCIAAQLQ
jgi:hypothetical protein